MKFAILYMVIIIVSLYSCKENEIDFGVSTYYPSFLWSKSDTSFVEKTIEFDFSDDAIVNRSQAEIHIIPFKDGGFKQNDIQISINNQFIKDRFVIVADPVKNPQLINIKVRFLPQTEAGKKVGVLRVTNHNLDRINESISSGTNQIEVIKWIVEFEKIMNPLKKAFFLFLLSLLTVILIWLLVLKKLVFPQFPRYKKLVYFGTLGAKNVIFSGYREVVFTNKKREQNWLQSLLKGKIKYVDSPIFISDITFKPRKKMAIAKYSSNDYRFSVNPIPRDGKAEIVINHSNTKVVLN